MGKATRWLKGLFSGKWATTRSTKTKTKEKLPVVCTGVGEDQNRRAIAVAAATAAVAEAAVAAAQAAAVVVRLTSTGRACGSAGRWKCEVWAAVRIQAAFRSYLARRALKALKGLVKLQALVRGHIIRKQVGEKIRCMQSLVKVQARARASRVLTDNYQDTITLHAGHPTSGKYERSSRGNRTKPERSRTPTRNATRVINASLSLSDHWMDEHCSDSQETTSRLRTPVVDDEKNAKILEVDTGKPHYNSRRRVRHHSMSSDQNSRSFITVPDSPSKDSTTVQRSIPSPSSVDNATSPLQFPLNGQELRESPHYYTATSLTGSARGGPMTPSKSECSRSVFSSYSGCPNYMAYTESSRAKAQARSQSAPKQRPEYDKPWPMKRQSSGQLRSGGSGSGGCQPSSSSQGSTSLHIKFSGKAYPGSGRLDRLGMPIT